MLSANRPVITGLPFPTLGNGVRRSPGWEIPCGAFNLITPTDAVFSLHDPVSHCKRHFLGSGISQNKSLFNVCLLGYRMICMRSRALITVWFLRMIHRDGGCGGQNNVPQNVVLICGTCDYAT